MSDTSKKIPGIIMTGLGSTNPALDEHEFNKQYAKIHFDLLNNIQLEKVIEAQYTYGKGMTPDEFYNSFYKYAPSFYTQFGNTAIYFNNRP
jgi:hypothetical protein